MDTCHVPDPGLDARDISVTRAPALRKLTYSREKHTSKEISYTS